MPQVILRGLLDRKMTTLMVPLDPISNKFKTCAGLDIQTPESQAQTEPHEAGNLSAPQHPGPL